LTPSNSNDPSITRQNIIPKPRARHKHGILQTVFEKKIDERLWVDMRFLLVYGWRYFGLNTFSIQP
jgi:hypothetical protein